MMAAATCVLLLLCFSFLVIDLIVTKKEIKLLRGMYDNLANFSLKHIQDNEHE